MIRHVEWHRILERVQVAKAAFLMAFLSSAAAIGADNAPERHFLDRVKPLLDSRCISCHGTEKQKGGLRLDSRAAMIKGGESGPAIVPGKPAESLLLKAVMHTKPELEMPPKEKLTTNDVAVFERWIREGAAWPEVNKAPEAAKLAPGERLGNAWSDPRNPIARIFGGQRLDLWSLKPIQHPNLPPARNKRWSRNGIDRFILAKLEASGLQPSAEADRRTLARRLYFDLTGLPPTSDQLSAFLADERSDAYERLVDRLLASRAYGEYAARQWLDVIRYSDSNGFDWDEFRPRAWLFRDYVIRSFAADKPFDQFIREQLAGDELVSGAPRTPTEQDALIATGYLRLGPHDNSAPAFNEQARSRAELMADLTETTGSAFLGLTLACCRCHDHKYDPLSQADHYRIRAFFEGVKFADDLPIDLAAEQERIRKTNETLEVAIKPLAKQDEAILSQAKTKLREERVAKLSAAEKGLLDLPKAQRTNELKAKVEALEKKIEPTEKEVLKSLTAEERAEHLQITRRLEELKKEKRSFTTALLMTDADTKPAVTKILFQGNHRDPRNPVEPGFLSVLDPNPATIPPAPNSKTTGRRLTLANWIASPTNPLAARVLANRVWQTHFGVGLAGTPNDFGLAGARPSHPELLDWLATEFVRSGWSQKALHRLIVTSATYRQVSSSAFPGADENRSALQMAVAYRRGNARPPKFERLNPVGLDADNHLLWRQNLRRLSAEQLRDGLLAVSGVLVERDGGKPVWPELPAEVLQANPAFLDDNAEKTKGWYPSPPREQNVRSVYLVQKRTVRVPFMETFDLPENSTSCPRRTESVVAPQALSLLNGRLAIDCARAMALRVKAEAGTDRRRQVERAFDLALQRSPDPEEQNACVRLLESQSLAELCRALLNLNEFLYID